MRNLRAQQSKGIAPVTVFLVVGLAGTSVLGEEAILWQQLPVGSIAMASQDDSCYPFRVVTADNFIASAKPVKAVQWWGAYWGDARGDWRSAEGSESFIFRIWESQDYGSYVCPVGTDGFGWLWETQILSVSKRPYDGGSLDSLYEYTGVLDEPFEPAAGGEYFVSVQANLCWPPLWGIADGSGDGRECCFVADPTFALDPWLPASHIWGVPYETAVVLFADDAVPVAETSWSQLKGLYSQ